MAKPTHNSVIPAKIKRNQRFTPKPGANQRAISRNSSIKRESHEFLLFGMK